MSSKQQITHSTALKMVNYAKAERPIPGAPVVSLAPEAECIPQHFLAYAHHYESVWEVVNDISFCTKYPIFVCEDNAGLYIQVGVIGYDNYSGSRADDSKHIVYGRKWRVEPNLPTCEIIQTVFLALKKAREHELRELLTLRSKRFAKASTPFSGHHDIPVMAQHLSATASPVADISAAETLAQLTFDTLPLKLHRLETITSGYVLTFSICFQDTDDRQPVIFPEHVNKPFSVLLSRQTPNAIMHAVMNGLLDDSDKYVAEHFKYRGFPRFSEQHELSEMGDLSIMLRDKEALNCPEFFQSFRVNNQAVDATRAPRVTNEQLAANVLDSLNRYHELSGHLPIVDKQ